MDANELVILLGVNVRKQRHALGLTQEQLSEYTGFSVSHISDIELGRTWVSAESLTILADKLLVAPWVLLFDEPLSDAGTAGEIIRNNDSSRRLSRRIADRMNDVVAEEIRHLLEESKHEGRSSS